MTTTYHPVRWMPGTPACAAIMAIGCAASLLAAGQKPEPDAAAKTAEGRTAQRGTVLPDPAMNYPVSDAPQMIDLPTALRLAGAQNLDVQIALQKVVEARAAHEQARQQFFPWISPGVSYRRHDGQLQDIGGNVFDASKQFYTVGGSINAQLDLGEAWYKTLAARQTAKAAEQGAEAERLQSVLAAATGYFDLVLTGARLEVVQQSLKVSEEYSRQLESAVRTGLAFKGDWQRVLAQTERYRLVVQRSGEQKRLTAARLATSLHLNPAVLLEPADKALSPLQLVDQSTPLDRLIAQALNQRPEIARQSALQRAALEEKRGVTVGPVIPSLGLQAYGGGLGGGFNDQWHNFDATSTEQVTLGWRIGPGGLMDRPRQKLAESRLKTAELTADKWRDAVVGQVVEAHVRVHSLAAQIETARRALAAAEETARLSFERRAFGVGAVLETLQAQQDLTTFRSDYLALIAEYNKAQYALEAAAGRLHKIK